MTKPCGLWDLDSTVCDTQHRQWMVDDIKAGRLTWDDYSMACGGDTPIEGAVTLIRVLAHQFPQFGVSGRAECALEATQEWGFKHEVPLRDYYLRPTGDRTPNGLHKVQIIQYMRAQGLDPVYLVEDWKETADEVREATGVPVLLVKGLYVDPDRQMIL